MPLFYACVRHFRVKTFVNIAKNKISKFLCCVDIVDKTFGALKNFSYYQKQ